MTGAEAKLHRLKRVGARVGKIVVTEAVRDGHWVHTTEGIGVLFVSAQRELLARELWPHANREVPDNRWMEDPP